MLTANRIEVNPDVLAGKPIIKGTRISVEIILNKVSAGKSWENIQDELDISKEDIIAAIKYAEKVIANEELFELVN
jgi:uncharacterized protein (DUF433 family)